MIVDNLHVIGFAVAPSKYDPPLIVDPDRMEASEITPQLLKMVGRRHTQILKAAGNVNTHKLPFSAVGKAVERTDSFVFEKSSGFAVAERPDHDKIYRIPVCSQS
jgi:hypothetical protein